MAIGTEIKPFEFYTPTPEERRVGFIDVPETLTTNKAFNRLLNKCLQPIEEGGNGRIKTFDDGGQTISPVDRQHREQFVREARAVVAERCKDLIGPNGEIDQRFTNLEEIAPELIRIMTSRDNHVGLVQQPKVLNIVAAALDKARQPNADMVITVGIGGSDDEFTPARFASYGLSALLVAEQIQDFFSQRKNNRLTSFAVNAAIARKQEELGGSSTTAEERANIRQQVTARVETEGIDSVLTYDDRQRAAEKYALSEKSPKVQFVFAHQAAIAINGTHKNPELIPVRTAERRAIMKEFVDIYFPKLSEHTQYIEDLPWDQHDSHTRLSIEYNAFLIETSQEPNIVAARERLKTRGEKHGGVKGAERAIMYAGLHPQVFGDPVNLPPFKYLEGDQNHSPIVITFGGQPEREFCVFRELIERTADPDGYITFLRSRASSHDPVELSILESVISSTIRWRSTEESARTTHMLPFISLLGESPSYFFREGYDMPHGTDLITNINHLTSKLEGLHQQGASREAMAERAMINAILVDLKALNAEQSRRATLMLNS